jgi:protein AroM
MHWVGKNAIGDRVQQILDEIDSEAFDLSVLLCTGHLPSLRARGMYLESQTLVDHGVRALSGGADLLGVILPLAEQEEQFDRRPFAGKTLRFSHASPYRLHRARELAHADVIVMHCIGYTKAQRQRVARMSGRPVLLARRLVAAAIGQLV